MNEERTTSIFHFPTGCTHAVCTVQGREGDSTMNPSYCIRNTGNSQNLFRAPQILFGFRSHMLSSKPPDPKSVKNA